MFFPTGEIEQPVKYVCYCVIIREATNVQAKDRKLFVEIWFSEGIQSYFQRVFSAVHMDGLSTFTNWTTDVPLLSQSTSDPINLD